jgi:hypothetical protein
LVRNNDLRLNIPSNSAVFLAETYILGAFPSFLKGEERMSTTVSLQNLLTLSNVSPKNASHQAIDSEEFSKVVTSASSGETSSQQESSSSMPTTSIPSTGMLQANAISESRLLTEQTEAAMEALTINRPEQSLLTLESTLAMETKSSSTNDQTISNIYNQANVDILGLERSFLELIQAVQKENIPQVRKLLGQLPRRRPRVNYSRVEKGELSSDPLERFLEEMESALAVNDLYTAQLTINSFLAHLGESRGSFVVTSV